MINIYICNQNIVGRKGGGSINSLCKIHIFIIFRIVGVLPRNTASQNEIQDYVAMNNLKKKTVPKDYYFDGEDGVLVYSKSKGKMVPIPRIG